MLEGVINKYIHKPTEKLFCGTMIVLHQTNV